MGYGCFIFFECEVLKLIYFELIKIFTMQQVSCSILSWTSENLSVNAFSNAFLYIEGNPVRPAQASPDFMTYKLSPFAPPEYILDFFF